MKTELEHVQVCDENMKSSVKSSIINWKEAKDGR